MHKFQIKVTANLHMIEKLKIKYQLLLITFTRHSQFFFFDNQARQMITLFSSSNLLTRNYP